MRRDIPSLSDLQTMKDQMTRVLNYLENSRTGEEEEWEWIEKLPKFQGTKRRVNLRLLKTNHLHG